MADTDRETSKSGRGIRGLGGERRGPGFGKPIKTSERW